MASVVSDQQDDADWLFDHLCALMAQERWEAPLAAFVDEHCAMFASLAAPMDAGATDGVPKGNSATRLMQAEHPLALTDLHRQWQELVESQTEAALAEVGVSPEVFAALCERSALGQDARPVNKRVLDTLLAASDYASFALMMARRNAQLEAQAARAIGQAVDGVSAIPPASDAGDSASQKPAGGWSQDAPATVSAEAAFAGSSSWSQGADLDAYSASAFAKDAHSTGGLTDEEVSALVEAAARAAEQEADKAGSRAKAQEEKERRALEEALDASLREADRHRLEAERELRELEEALAASLREEEARIRALQEETKAVEE